MSPGRPGPVFKNLNVDKSVRGQKGRNWKVWALKSSQLALVHLLL
jgi:hypothetical protein